VAPYLVQQRQREAKELLLLWRCKQHTPHPSLTILLINGMFISLIQQRIMQLPD